MNQGVTSEQLIELLNAQQDSWPLAKTNYDALARVKTRSFDFESFQVKVQFNPARIVSSSANVDERSVKARKCFLCPENLPEEQKGILFKDYQLLVNPFPIFPQHFTIPALKHEKQLILNRYRDMLELAQMFDMFVIFYNGPRSGASAPDHMHFQAGNKGFLPVEREYKTVERELVISEAGVELYRLKDYLREVVVIEAGAIEDAVSVFKRAYSWFDGYADDAHCADERGLKKGLDIEEPMLNLISWYEKETGHWVTLLFPRKKHRPGRYYAAGMERMLISPGSVDMGGVMITPREEDFEKITAMDIIEIFREVTLWKR